MQRRGRRPVRPCSQVGLRPPESSPNCAVELAIGAHELRRAAVRRRWSCTAFHRDHRQQSRDGGRIPRSPPRRSWCSPRRTSPGDPTISESFARFSSRRFRDHHDEPAVFVSERQCLQPMRRFAWEPGQGRRIGFRLVSEIHEAHSELPARVAVSASSSMAPRRTNRRPRGGLCEVSSCSESARRGRRDQSTRIGARARRFGAPTAGRQVLRVRSSSSVVQARPPQPLPAPSPRRATEWPAGLAASPETSATDLHDLSIFRVLAEMP